MTVNTTLPDLAALTTLSPELYVNGLVLSVQGYGSYMFLNPFSVVAPQPYTVPAGGGGWIWLNRPFEGKQIITASATMVIDLLSGTNIFINLTVNGIIVNLINTLEMQDIKIWVRNTNKTLTFPNTWKFNTDKNVGFNGLSCIAGQIVDNIPRVGIIKTFPD